MRLCRVCGDEKDLAEFAVRKENGRHRTECRDCAKALSRLRWSRDRDRNNRQQRAHYAANQERIVNERREERASRTVEINARRRELRVLDPERFRKLSRDYFDNNPEKYAAHKRRCNKRKRAKRAADGDSAFFAELVRRDPCSYCGVVGGTWDHIEPEAKGGSHRWHNATGACLRCNTSKQDEDLLIFLLRKAGEPKVMPSMPQPSTPGSAPEPAAA